MQYLNVSGFWKPSVKSNIFVYFHQHSIGNRNIKVIGSLHLELVHCFPRLGNVDLVVALHFRFSPFDVFRGFSSAVIALPLFSGISLLVSGKTGWKGLRIAIWEKNSEQITQRAIPQGRVPQSFRYLWILVPYWIAPTNEKFFMDADSKAKNTHRTILLKAFDRYGNQFDACCSPKGSSLFTTIMRARFLPTAESKKVCP